MPHYFKLDLLLLLLNNLFPILLFPLFKINLFSGRKLDLRRLVCDWNPLLGLLFLVFGPYFFFFFLDHQVLHFSFQLDHDSKVLFGVIIILLAIYFFSLLFELFLELDLLLFNCHNFVQGVIQRLFWRFFDVDIYADGTAGGVLLFPD